MTSNDIAKLHEKIEEFAAAILSAEIQIELNKRKQAFDEMAKTERITYQIHSLLIDLQRLTNLRVWKETS